jgi:hypothetical protein
VVHDGLVHLVAQVLDDWQTIAVSTHVTFPGVTGRFEQLYRDTTQDPRNIEKLVSAALRQLRYRGLG